MAGAADRRACSGSRRSRSRPSPSIHGLCLTAGLEVSLGCDLIWAEESSKFGLVEAVVGLTPGAGGTQRMAERAGPGAGARVRDDRRPLRRRDAGALGRDQPRRPRRHRAREGDAVRRSSSPSGPTHGPRGDQADRPGLSPTAASSAADEVTPEQFAELFETEDLQDAVRSFLADGPGKATFEGK